MFRVLGSDILLFLMMEYIAKLTNATATVASRLIPSGVAAKTASGAKIEVEDTQYGAESVVTAPMTHREVSASSAMFVL
ncbi:hypothetical protein [Wolbachia endosymbiont (group B) of Cyclophora punctaria]|uniref:hypothetical protein n=1 Tax=Wolbachia endosymbiont (group B) of Cyclophora punctaria TaxID=3066168 RepID=UPI0033410925